MTGGLTLRDEGAAGWLEPYLAGLRLGQAIAGHCTDCGRVSLPPEAVCPVCRLPVTALVTLPGTATLIARTTGTEGDVALVQFDGATTASVAALRGFTNQTLGRIVATPADRPHLILMPEVPE
jgi:uncharacterized OB-fold protein